MTSLKSTLERLPKWVWIPFVLFLLLGVHSAAVGLTDDEAYYWVLAQRPAWGYAYHPPAIAWVIASAQWLFGPLFGTASAGLVRLPAYLIGGVFLFFTMKWIERIRGQSFEASKVALVLISVPGFLALSWMIVPDVPLYLGWILAFYSTYRICFDEETRELRLSFGGVLVGVALSIFSKYSGILVAGSCFFSILFFAPRGRRLSALAAIAGGVLLSVIPTLIWNAHHGWTSLEYQFRGRHHSNGISWKRFARFWGSQLLVAGPGVVIALPFLLKKAWVSRDKNAQYLLAWIFPALAFLVQPLFSEFKPHWALAVWIPCAIGLALFAGSSPAFRRLARAQLVIGLPIVLIVFISLYFPVGAYFSKDPKLDVSNDLFGWSELPSVLDQEIPVIGSRYQTAAQAAFALGDANRVTLVPRDEGSRDEWASIPEVGPASNEWPNLHGPVYFVADSRYSDPPYFKYSLCDFHTRIDAKRGDTPAKEIFVWYCVPN
jgi:4-amino-4-deoxy-L-arabinose transferase-like glycosyltransferase